MRHVYENRADSSNLISFHLAAERTLPLGFLDIPMLGFLDILLLGFLYIQDNQKVGGSREFISELQAFHWAQTNQHGALLVRAVSSLGREISFCFEHLRSESFEHLRSASKMKTSFSI